MFFTPTTQVWTPSAATVTVTTNTDFSIDGSSHKLVWDDGLNETVTISFDSIDLSQYEEISFYLSQRVLNLPSDLYSLTVDGETFSWENITSPGWNHILIDCSGMSAVTEIVITSLVDDLVLFIDVLGVRKVGHDRDIDVLKAFKEAISLDYDVSTTLSANLAADGETISLTSTDYITNHSVLEIDNGAGTTAEVQLTNRGGALLDVPGTAFTSGDTVNVLCPTRMADHDYTDPDPICGITFFDKMTGNETVSIPLKNGHALKLFTGALGVLVYIDCSSREKLLQLSREFDYNYGERFNILLDGEVVFVLLESSQFVDDSIGNNPRIAYFYRVEPQPYTVAKAVQISSLTINLESEPVSTILE